MACRSAVAPPSPARSACSVTAFSWVDLDGLRGLHLGHHLGPGRLTTMNLLLGSSIAASPRWNRLVRFLSEMARAFGRNLSIVLTRETVGQNFASWNSEWLKC